ncbi:Hypothetical predicted protein [Cloeon dipterum]|uniref:Uncharacterized protein n=1 Tax=Cloeon dipterum TaxID=197152 RepID=A0A8S1D255_9INSE|nr:Hypothetical predicted protein [Cloeon dipterum]
MEDRSRVRDRQLQPYLDVRTHNLVDLNQVCSRYLAQGERTIEMREYVFFHQLDTLLPFEWQFLKTLHDFCELRFQNIRTAPPVVPNGDT